jgi:hypothetical protein
MWEEINYKSKRKRRAEPRFELALPHPLHDTPPPTMDSNDAKKTGSFSLIKRVILSAGAMLIFSVSFQIDQMPEGNRFPLNMEYQVFLDG